MSRLGPFTVDVREWQPVENGHGERSVKIGTRTASVDVVVDWQKLIPYAVKALENKSGKARMCNGGLTFVVAKETLREAPLTPVT